MVLDCHPVLQRRLSGTDLVLLVTIGLKLGLSLNNQAFLAVYVPVWMVFKGRGFTSGGQKSASGFSATACKIQGSKCYIESLPLV